MDIIRAAYKYHMFTAGDKVLAAVSGGQDSVAMLHALHTRSEELGIALHVAHLNHGLRGQSSRSDEAFVLDLAQTCGLECSVGHVDVHARMNECGEGEEEAARALRYKFLADTATDVGASKIAVGHTADDRAESVLMNILRGSGIDGLGSIRPVRGIVVRPLIDTRRAEVESYIREHGLSYRTDESNLDVTYSRNRIRHKLLPLLERDYNPQVTDALVRLAQLACDYADFAHKAGASARRFVAHGAGLDVDLMLRLPPPLADEIVRSEILRLKGDLKDVTFEQVRRVVENLQTPGDFTIPLPSGKICAVKQGRTLQIRRLSEAPKEISFEVPLRIPGVTTVPDIKLTVEASVIERPTARKTGKNELLLNAEALTGSLRIRSIRPGDRITPFGMKGTKKLQDVLVDCKIPREERQRTPLVVDDEKVLWVIGVVGSEAARVTDKTRRAVYLSAAFEENWKLD